MPGMVDGIVDCIVAGTAYIAPGATGAGSAAADGPKQPWAAGAVAKPYEGASAGPQPLIPGWQAKSFGMQSPRWASKSAPGMENGTRSHEGTVCGGTATPQGIAEHAPANPEVLCCGGTRAGAVPIIAPGMTAQAQGALGETVAHVA